MLLAFEDERALAEALAEDLGLALAFIREHRFPDGELKLTLPPTLPSRVVMLRGLHRPNEKLVALLLAAGTARRLGATDLTLVSPYLAYMRQDIEFNPGEAISQGIVAGFLANLFDAVVTIDPHLHRIASLDEVMPRCRGIALTAAPLLGTWIAGRFEAGRRPLIVGPDEEAGQWVSAAAAASGLDGVVCTKTRRGDRDVVVEVPPVPLEGRAVVLLDDVASTGQTLVEAALALRARGVASIDAVVTHALFVGDAAQRLAGAGIGRIWSTDAVPHPTNAISVAPLIAGAITQRSATGAPDA